MGLSAVSPLELPRRLRDEMALGSKRNDLETRWYEFE